MNAIEAITYLNAGVSLVINWFVECRKAEPLVVAVTRCVVGHGHWPAILPMKVPVCCVGRVDKPIAPVLKAFELPEHFIKRGVSSSHDRSTAIFFEGQYRPPVE